MGTCKFLLKLMVKGLCLAHFQLKIVLSLQLIWCLRRSLSYCIPQRHAMSSFVATKLGLQEDILLHLQFHFFKRILCMDLYTLTFCLALFTSVSPTEEGDESDEEVPLAIPLYPNRDDVQSKEAQHNPSKLTALKPAASPKPKVILEETKNPGKSKADDDDDINEEDDDGSGQSGGDEGMSDEQDSSDDDGESSDEEETPPKNTKGKNRPVETHLKTPPQKKAKLATPVMDHKACGTGGGKRSGYVHVATPHPAKQAKKTPANNVTKNSTGYACKSCSKTFNSPMGLETHSKMKHTATKPV
ncbi:hypothetical protein GUJ93_ZPchr0001g30953 [Zizania palustris]|uniref:C2H2-type domain-containing protein n=1 Tax=Zizania palustris TaxID=103762 RepID=A0A8J5R947_ZIZPA|nr:hypothetical protein GUJ93_ZPchr0001g30953 [Zizania palustris]